MRTSPEALDTLEPAASLAVTKKFSFFFLGWLLLAASAM